MPGVIGRLVNRIKSGLTAKVFKLFVASIIAVCMLFGIMPACESHAAFAQNTSGGGAALTEPSASSSGSGSVVKQEKPEDPNNLFANNPKLKEALYYRVKADSDVSVPDSIDRWHPTESDMARVKKLDLENWKIDDVRFLKYFPNLEDLNLSENTISDISQLPSLKNLKKLDLRRNNISIIPVLNGLPNLESLDISENKISNVDNLANLCAGKLINVKAEKNNITNIDKIYPYALAKNTAFYNDFHSDTSNLYEKKYDSLYDFSNQRIEKNITTQQAKDGYNYSQLLKSSIKDEEFTFSYNYAYAGNTIERNRHYTPITDELIRINKNDGVKLIDFNLKKKMGMDMYNGTSDVHHGPDFRFNGRLLIRQYVIKRINIEVSFGQSIDFKNALKNSELSGYSGKISDLGLEFCGYDSWGGYVNFNAPDNQTAFFPGKQTFEFPVCYKNGEIKNNIEGYHPVDNFTFIVNAKTMAETWPAKSSDVKIDDIDSASQNPPAKQPTVESIKTDVKNKIDKLFGKDGSLKYPVIPDNLKIPACYSCDPNESEDGCSNVDQDECAPYNGFDPNNNPNYFNDDGEEVSVFKNIGDYYYENCYDVDNPDACTPKYYYKAPTVTVGNFEIPTVTSEDQTVKVPVTVSYVDGSQCKFDASFTVKAKPNPTPKPQPHNPPTPQPQPQPGPQPTPTPVPTPDPQNPPVAPAPAPTPDQPETPSGQSHMTEPEILPKPYLNIDVTTDSNIDVTPNNGSANSNTTNLYPNQRQDAARDDAAKNAEPSVTPTKCNKTGAFANLKSHKSRGTIPATGSESSLIAIVAILSILLGVVAICKCKFKQYIL